MTVTYDVLSPFPWLKQMRLSTPVAFDEQFHLWQAFRYRDVQRILSDYAVFSSDVPGVPPENGSILTLGPPRHNQLRALVAEAFAPQTIAGMEGRIRQIVNEQLDLVEKVGQMDVIDDLASPLTTIIIAEMLGLPAEDRAQLRHWSDQIVGVAPLDPGKNPGAALGTYFQKHLAERQLEPREDLMSALLAARIDGVPLSMGELISFCMLLLVSGNQTARTLLGNAVQTFDEHPEVMEELRANPSFMPNAIEEVLRYRSPVRIQFRGVVRETELRGQTIYPGQSVAAWVASANRDEEQFTDPDVFDIHRTPNRHLTFGHGIHFCLGAPLGRLQARIALNMMLDRWSEIKLIAGIPLKPLGSPFPLGLKHLPITFSMSPSRR